MWFLYFKQRLLAQHIRKFSQVWPFFWFFGRGLGTRLGLGFRVTPSVLSRFHKIMKFICKCMFVSKTGKTLAIFTKYSCLTGTLSTQRMYSYTTVTDTYVLLCKLSQLHTMTDKVVATTIDKVVATMIDKVVATTIGKVVAHHDRQGGGYHNRQDGYHDRQGGGYHNRQGGCTPW